jgi:hypothetical protein
LYGEMIFSCSKASYLDDREGTVTTIDRFERVSSSV